jgi:hypothetical protein
MSKTLWHTIKLEVPKEMINITKNDKVVVKKALTKTNNISKSNNEPSIKIIPGNTNKPKIINDGKEWNIEELKLKMTKAKELGKKNEGKVLKKKINIDEKFRKFKDENVAYTTDWTVDKPRSKDGLIHSKKRILFDKKSKLEGKLFYSTVPQDHFEQNLKFYKKYTHGDLSMKEVKKLFDIGWLKNRLTTKIFFCEFM